MSSSTGSNDARASWITIIRRLLGNLRAEYQYDEITPNEDSFRQKFDKFPAGFNLPSSLRNYGNFFRLHKQIISVVSTLDEALGLKAPESLSSVFWTYVLAALNAAIRQGYEFRDLTDIYETLNSPEDIPIVDSDLRQFPESIRVQEPLQEIFETYIDCYFVFVSQYVIANEEEGVDIVPIRETITAASTKYRKAEYTFRSRLSEAIKHMNSHELDSGDTTLVDTSAPRGIQFARERTLGKGAYGTVYEVRETSTGVIYAMKSIATRIVGQAVDSIDRRVRNEVEIMSKLRHNHIVSLNILFREPDSWNMVMSPVADCDLRVFLDEKCVGEGFPKEYLQMIDPWFGCLISALAYAHTESVKHEDIKPNNILICGEKVYLTDFGTAMDFSQLEKSTVSYYFEQGTPIYWAPEPRAWGRPADVFALGCVFSEMLTVRQGRSLQDYRDYRYDPKKDFGYAYRSNLSMVRQWLKKELRGINARDKSGQRILEQILNMLVEDPHERTDAFRLRKVLAIEPSLFCPACV